MFIGSPYNAQELKNVGFDLGVGPTFVPNHYNFVGGVRKRPPPLPPQDPDSLGILRPNFQHTYKRINYQYLTFFHQIQS